MSICSTFNKGDATTFDTARPPPQQCAPPRACVNLVRPRLRLRALQVDPGSIGDAARPRTGRTSLL